MQTIDGHSFDETLLTPGGWVLDVGCRGFGFARWMAEHGMKVLALDPDPEIVDPKIPGVEFMRRAIIGRDGEGVIHFAKYASWSTGEGNYITDAPPSYAATAWVECIGVADAMKYLGITEFDLIKLDCEGAEYEILRRLPPRCAKQLSVEFHDFLGRNPFEPDRERFYAELFAGMGDYDIVQHERTLGQCNQLNYWDSILILRASYARSSIGIPLANPILPDTSITEFCERRGYNQGQTNPEES